MPTCASSQQLTQLTQTVKLRLSQLQTAVASLGQCPKPLLQTTGDDPILPTHSLLFADPSTVYATRVYSIEFKKDTSSISKMACRIQYIDGNTSEMCVWTHVAPSKTGPISATWYLTEWGSHVSDNVLFTVQITCQGMPPTCPARVRLLPGTGGPAAGYGTILTVAQPGSPFSGQANMSDAVTAQGSWLIKLLKGGASWRQKRDIAEPNTAPDTITLKPRERIGRYLSWDLDFQWNSGGRIQASGPSTASIRTHVSDDPNENCYIPAQGSLLENTVMSDTLYAGEAYGDGESSLYYQYTGLYSTACTGWIVFVVNQTPYADASGAGKQHKNVPAYLRVDSSGSLYLHSNVFKGVGTKAYGFMRPIQYDLIPAPSPSHIVPSLHAHYSYPPSPHCIPGALVTAAGLKTGDFVDIAITPPPTATYVVKIYARLLFTKNDDPRSEFALQGLWTGLTSVYVYAGSPTPPGNTRLYMVPNYTMNRLDVATRPGGPVVASVWLEPGSTPTSPMEAIFKLAGDTSWTEPFKPYTCT